MKVHANTLTLKIYDGAGFEEDRAHTNESGGFRRLNNFYLHHRSRYHPESQIYRLMYQSWTLALEGATSTARHVASRISHVIVEFEVRGYYSFHPPGLKGRRDRPKKEDARGPTVDAPRLVELVDRDIDSGLLYREYVDDCQGYGLTPLTPRRIHGLLTECARAGLIQRRVEYRGRYGRTTVYSSVQADTL